MEGQTKATGSNLKRTVGLLNENGLLALDWPLADIETGILAPVEAGVRNKTCVGLKDEIRELTSSLLKNKTG